MATTCTTCHKRRADLYDDASGKALCAKCWLKKHPKG